MRKFFEILLKSSWLPFVGFVVFLILGNILVSLLFSPSASLFYTDQRMYTFKKSALAIASTGVLILAAGAVLFSFVYKIKNRLWAPLIFSIAIFVFFVQLQIYIKRGVGGRFISVEEVDGNLQADLKELTARLAAFRNEKGFYPAALKEIQGKGFHWKTMFRSDKNGRDLDPEGWPFRYQVSDDKKVYELRSAGWDRKYNTVDDIVGQSQN